MPESVIRDIAQWRNICPSIEPDAWLFPSEKLTTSFSRENCWQRNLGPRLKANGLGWVNFQVMRRTHSSLNRRLEAVRRLENACLAADAA
ncbi:MAG: hypothetical protein R2748_18240 [Bryobacterales bacterium]